MHVILLVPRILCVMQHIYLNSGGLCTSTTGFVVLVEYDVPPGLWRAPGQFSNSGKCQ